MKNVEIINELFRVKNLLTKASSKEIFWEDGLTVGLFGILKMIDHGVDDIAEMKKEFSESSASFTQKINKLEEKGLIKKEERKNDKRKIKVIITVKGKKIFERIEKKIEMMSSILFLKYSKKEKESFLKILRGFSGFIEKKLKNKIEIKNN